MSKPEVDWERAAIREQLSGMTEYMATARADKLLSELRMKALIEENHTRLLEFYESLSRRLDAQTERLSLLERSIQKGYHERSRSASPRRK